VIVTSIFTVRSRVERRGDQRGPFSRGWVFVGGWGGCVGVGGGGLGGGGGGGGVGVGGGGVGGGWVVLVGLEKEGICVYSKLSKWAEDLRGIKLLRHILNSCEQEVEWLTRRWGDEENYLEKVKGKGPQTCTSMKKLPAGGGGENGRRIIFRC